MVVLGVPPRVNKLIGFEITNSVYRESETKVERILANTENTEDGRFDPEYIAVDQRTGKVYVTDKRYHRVDEFDSNGTFVSYLGADNSLYANPVGIAVAPLDPKIYVTDDATNTIKIFALNPD